LIELKTCNIFAIVTVYTFSLFCQHNREKLQKNSEFHGFELQLPFKRLFQNRFFQFFKIGQFLFINCFPLFGFSGKSVELGDDGVLFVKRVWK